MLDLGYFPQLPDTVTGPCDEAFHGSYNVGSTFGTGIDGHLLHVFIIPALDAPVSDWKYAVKNLRFPSREAVKAYCLRHGYTVPWRYYGEKLYREAV